MSILRKNNKLSIYLVTFLLVVILFFVGYICYDKGYIYYSDDDIVDNNQNDNTVSEKESVNNEEDINKDGESIKDNSNNNNVIKELDLTKCLNTDGISYSNNSDIEENYGLSMIINSDKKSITLTTDNDVFMPIVNSVIIGSTWEPNSTSTYQINGFTKEVISFFVGELGHSANGLTLFFLMEDGTVEYTPLFVQNKNNDGSTYYDLNFSHDYTADKKIIDTYFMSMGKVYGVEGVIKFYNVDASTGFDWRTTIGAKVDGSFYDLGNAIQNIPK